MALRHRPMQPKDVGECVDIVASHPVIGPRYRNQIADLRRGWLDLHGRLAHTAVVLEEGDGRNWRALGVGVSVFVSDSFLAELKTPPFFWYGPELATRSVNGNSPLLSDQEVREKNVSGGMNVVCWEGCLRPEVETRSEVYNKLMGAFVEEHRGYLWNEIIATQAESALRLQSMMRTGAMWLSAERGHWVDAADKNLEEAFRKPHVVGLARGMPSIVGSWAGALFDYSPPRFGFTRSEQQLLSSALRGGTDEELSVELGISISAVKKTWQTIYERVTARRPDLTPLSKHSDSAPHDRGKEKKQHLIAYLRDHPEELRPVSRKLLERKS
jgi:DNA-binding CsgD family transcriptional regulator